MEWVKIFENEAEARSRITEHKPQLLIVKGQRICLALHDGEFFAVQDACTHNGESLSKGQVNYLGEIICPLHNYRFQLNTGRACDSSSNDLRTFGLKRDNFGFFIGI